MKSKSQAIIFVIALGFLLRILPLNQSYWLDESINVRAASSRGFVDLITNYAIGDFHPPLYHLLLKSWILIFGNLEIYTRLLSVLFGLVTLWTTIYISKIIFKNQKFTLGKYKIWTFLIPPFLLSISGLDIYYSGEARMYALAAMGTTMSVYFLLQLLPKISIKKYLSELFSNPTEVLKSQAINLKSYNSIGLIISLLIMLMADYVPWLLYPVFFVLLPIQSLIALGLTAPWWPYFYKQLQAGLGTASDFPLWSQVVGGISFKNILLIPVKFTLGRVSIDNNLIYGVLIGLILLILGLLVFKQILSLNNKSKLKLFIPLIWLFFPIIVGIIVSFKISLLSYFRFLFVLPAFYIVLTQGLTKLSSKYLKVFLIPLVLITAISTSSYIFLPRFHREDWRAMSTWVSEIDNQNSITLIPNMAQADPYLFYQNEVPIFDNPEIIFAMPETVFLIRYVQEIFDPQDQLRVTLETLGYKVVDQKNFNGVVVWQYQRSDNLFATKL